MAELTRRGGGHVAVDVPDQGMHLIAYLRPPLVDVDVEQARAGPG